MNRKISTLFTAGLLVAGSLCGSAFAQNSIQSLLGLGSAVTDLKSGAYVMTDASGLAYGFTSVSEDGVLQEGMLNYTAPTITDDKKDDVKQYIWKVTVTENLGAYSYKFENVATGKTLRVNTTTGSEAVELNSAASGNAVKDVFAFGSAQIGTTGKYAAGEEALFAYNGNKSNVFQLTWDATDSYILTTSSSFDLSFYKVESEELGVVGAEELNDLYNTAGFSFISKRLDSDQTSEPNGNLFNEKRVVARYVPADLNVDATTYPSYSGGSADLKIPQGMYFFTENAPSVDDCMGTNAVSNGYKAWMDATVLVLSSTETVEGTNAGRASGDGFMLVEKKISELNLYQGSSSNWKAAGDEISINNASFRVQKSYSEDYPYELNVDQFRYRKQASKADQADAKVKLHILKHNDNYYLATTSTLKDASNNPINYFIFKQGAAGMKSGIELLNTEAKVSAYTIRVLGGKNVDKKDIKSVYGKYLTNAVNGGAFEFVAKAKVLSQLETPAYQWAISSVDDTYKVTFTNRETGEHFQASLFPKADLGENVYELATDNKNVTAIYVDENTYREAEGDGADMQQLIVELTPAEVDPYAGFLNVDNETLVTMAFARDNNETSNKWYVAATENNISSLSNYILNKNGKFANEVSGAAQWQLVKEDNKRTIIERSFVYNKDGRVTVQARGDKAYAYVYRLQYINDGIETKEYFPAGRTSFVTPQEELADENNTTRFVIKQAVDGSVYLIKVTSTSSNIASILNANTKSVVDATYRASIDECQYTVPSSVYAWPIPTTPGRQQDWLLNTYLIVEAPEISYPAEEGHISLISEMNNYISMNEDRDGIVVNENQYSFYLQVTDEDAVVPSFYISDKGTVEDGDRLFLFNPKDSVNYYVADGTYDRKYQWNENDTKAIFKPATLLESKDTLTTIVKGNKVSVAEEADDEGVLGGLDCFKVQIIQCEDDENAYRIRSVANKSSYLYSVNDKLSWSGSKTNAMRFTITAGDPTSNESIADATEGIKVIAGNGMIEIQGAAGKMVSVTNVLGKSIANTVLTSDNATITVPAGIVVVSVEGEEAVKAIVK